MWEILKLQHCKRSDSFDKITDMCNGDVMRLDSFFDVPENAGVMLCTDGVPVFKSSCKLYCYYLIAQIISLFFR